MSEVPPARGGSGPDPYGKVNYRKGGAGPDGDDAGPSGAGGRTGTGGDASVGGAGGSTGGGAGSGGGGLTGGGGGAGAGTGGGGRTGAGEGAGAGRAGRRGLVPGLVSRYPLGLQLPGVYAEDDFIQRFTAALDDVLAPVLTTLDNLPAYLTPALTPPDFLTLLAGWLGTEPAAHRSGVSGAVHTHAIRGTRAGLAEEIRLTFGVTPEIQESGAAAGSTTPGTPLPGTPTPFLTVRLHVPDPATFDTRALTALVARSRPAHLPFTVEVLAEG